MILGGFESEQRQPEAVLASALAMAATAVAPVLGKNRDDLTDEIDSWVIEEFKKVGLDTAKSILELDVKELIQRTDLEEETISEVIKILKEEFEDEA